VKVTHDVAGSRIVQHSSRGLFERFDAVELARGGGIQQRVARGRVE
jgi:hypothetical protein